MRSIRQLHSWYGGLLLAVGASLWAQTGVAAKLSQDESAVAIPAPQKRVATQHNAQRNLYWGDTHVHTMLSFDAYLWGNRMTLSDAYRFANGEALTLPTGEVMQLTRPLDFVVMTDHAESFGILNSCARKDLQPEQRAFCDNFDRPSREFFFQLRRQGEQRPPVRVPELCGGEKAAMCAGDAQLTWQQVRDTADEFNKPGEFSAFIGYEYSPPLPQQGKIHRNVIFRGSDTTDRAISAFDAPTVLDLWRTLEAECTGDCEFLTIPHNMNKSWGIAYSGRTIDGDAYEPRDWALRERNEPLAEIFQIKGNSECGFGVGATDEECNFELFAPICPGDQQTGCSGPTSFAREGLKRGMELQQELGFNPLRFGMVGSTDTHNSNPGDAEEYDYRGASGVFGSPAQRRLGAGNTLKPAKDGLPPMGRRRNPGGLAAVWATENTRDAIFDAMRARETYATSGNRIQLRFFAGSDLDESLLNDPELVRKAYARGVPMGGVLPAQGAESPAFLVWAQRDALAAPLQKVQMVKAWLADGESHEQVVDIACSDNLKPGADGRCPDNGASVDLSDCSISSDRGATEMKLLWRDPKFDAAQDAVYYVRVLENPSCRWSTYDALRLGVPPMQDVPATIQERAWSSPIWYTAPAARR